MKFGVCCSTENFTAAADLGFEYVETAFNKLVSMDETEYNQYLAALSACGLKSEVCNLFFTSENKLVGPEADYSFVDAYVSKGMERAARAGCKVAVIGSGGARRIPEGFSREKAAEQFASLLRKCGEISVNYGIKIAIEPLNTDETNFINTVAEGLEMCALADHPNVGLIADFYHIFKNGESLEAVENAGEKLFHAHIARADGDRCVPASAEDFAACLAWAAALKKSGYSGRLSFECKYRTDFETDLKNVGSVFDIFR